MREESLLSIQNLSICFGVGVNKVQVVDDFTLNIKKGKIYGLVGESGSGKSVSMLSICGLVPKIYYDSGKILFQDETGKTTDLINANRETMMNVRGRQIAYVFQEPMTGLNPLMTCGKQVAEACFEVRDTRTEVLRLFNEVKLPDPERIYNSYPHQISGGQRQRVMIAMAIANKPQLLIADEPTTALDASVQKTIVDLLVNLSKNLNMAMVFISHDLMLVKSFADEVTVMYKGKVMEQGEAGHVFNNPQHPYTKALLRIHPSYHQKGEYLATLDHLLNREDMSSLPQKSDVEYWPKELTIAENTILSGEKLLKKFGRKTGFKTISNVVLKEIDLEVFEGETLGIVGESGCGKSTLAKILVRLHSPDGGTLTYKGKSIFDIGKRYSREVQMVFQDPYSSLNPRKRVGEALTEPMKVHNILPSSKARVEKAKELLESVGLDPALFERYPHELSGGQRQRLCIARALSVNPRVIICDESVSALDVSVQAQILNLLKKLQVEKNLTYIFISHDLNVVAYLSDRIMVMSDGSISEIATTKEIIENPKSDYTRTLLGLMEGRLSGVI
jgi:peptide/nickel transport system ATP-binding protein